MHNYLGMVFDFTKLKQVKITMYNYFKKKLNKNPTWWQQPTLTSTAAAYLFQVDNEGAQ